MGSNMRVLIEVGHPAHVHYWKNVIWGLEREGHEVKIAARSKEITLQLLRAYSFDFDVLSYSTPDLVSKGLDMLKDDMTLLRLAKRCMPDLLISTGMPACAQVSRILGKPHIALIDTEHASLTLALTLPFTDVVCTPSSFKREIDSEKHLPFDGYLELMYLHPNYFTPDPKVLDAVGISKGEEFFLVRFSSWDSSHDRGDSGFTFRTNEERLKFLQKLEEYGRVLLTTEIPLNDKTRKYSIDIPPENIHSLLSFATAYIGEGATMASESSVLGVPWVFVSTRGRGYLDEQEKRYELGYRVDEEKEALKKILQILETTDFREMWQRKRERMLEEKIDVTRFMLDLISNWPESLTELRERARRREVT